MDPQQRLLLEVVYEALENAGITLEEVSGSGASVFCGSFTNDYNAMLTKDLEYYPKYTVSLLPTRRRNATSRTSSNIDRLLALVTRFSATESRTSTTFMEPV